MPGNNEESKEGGDDDIVRKFTEYCCQGDVQDHVDRFVDENCETFQGASLDEEGRLEWTDLHKSYTEMVELCLESFCKENDITNDAIFEKLSELNNDDDVNQDFLPAVIKLCEYSFFFANMVETANARKDAREAEAMKEDAVDERVEFNLSGRYAIASDYTDPNGVDEYYKFCGAPWYFRKLLVAATQRMQEVIIQHDEKKQLTFK
ncbi:hypothetical protein TeGR_g3484 [Tetraparma gracilis]|uniref:Cilia- and flagella-associated protein 36 n=1 Tax=Tetraparma gracilis TaxID=2962635 RepID=A0ABQ6MH47_9STRA|nr:hypothetical protein TeGR_g3484 [Tetraparma gracilis]